MNQFSDPDRARKEQVFRRKQIALRRLKQQHEDYNDDNSVTFSPFWSRRIAPFFVLILIFFVLFLMGRIITSASHGKVAQVVMLESDNLSSFEVEEQQAIHNFYLEPQFSQGIKASTELQIEILDEKLGHVYSFYKDLWQEQDYDDEGNLVMYRDAEMHFSIELPKGNYFLRFISFNGDNTGIKWHSTYQRWGSLYFGTYMWTLGFLLLVLFIGAGKWGTFPRLIAEFKKRKPLSENVLFLRSAAVLMIIYVSCWAISYTHYGYAGNNDYNHGPSKFIDKENVIYLG